MRTFNLTVGLISSLIGVAMIVAVLHYQQHWGLALGFVLAAVFLVNGLVRLWNVRRMSRTDEETKRGRL
ncbi:MAG: hypothetical protein M1136_03660 [Chloroflexi bacterium]|nr:hypothetical protein [Chloroflexota bacterium]MCL5074736.1 hypothetical protein [Chloroflexota bacterium]